LRSASAAVRCAECCDKPASDRRRLKALRAGDNALGLHAVGFDISSGQLAVARHKAERFRARVADDGIDLTFRRHDLCQRCPGATAIFTSCYAPTVVLNHLPKRALPRAIAELCRVSCLRVIATVQALAGPPTGCIIGLEQLGDYREDCSRGLLTLVLKDGSAHRLTFNLFSAEMLKTLFATGAGIVDLRPVDLFLSRFAPEAKWSSTLVNALPGREDVMRKLKEIEEQLWRQLGWVDHGTHILIVAEAKR
jgi:hypothetical protein